MNVSFWLKHDMDNRNDNAKSFPLSVFAEQLGNCEDLLAVV